LSGDHAASLADQFASNSICETKPRGGRRAPSPDTPDFGRLSLAGWNPSTSFPADSSPGIFREPTGPLEIVFESMNSHANDTSTDPFRVSLAEIERTHAARSHSLQPGPNLPHSRRVALERFGGRGNMHQRRC